MSQVKLGQLTINREPVTLPTYPWTSGYTHDFSENKGDIHEYDGGLIDISDAGDEGEEILWNLAEHNGKQLLIASCNLLTRISWDQLNEQGLIYGRKITLGGKDYLLRVLTGGIKPFEGEHEWGGDNENEWDDIIVNKAGISNLPVPTARDLETDSSEEKFKGEPNFWWNWSEIYSWCQDVREDRSSIRAIRGYNSARYWYIITSSNRSTSIGWRPVLELLSSESLNSDKTETKEEPKEEPKKEITSDMIEYEKFILGHIQSLYDQLREVSQPNISPPRRQEIRKFEMELREYVNLLIHLRRYQLYT